MRQSITAARAAARTCALWFAAALVVFPTALGAQANRTAPDTVPITLRELETRFLERNLELLAARFDIDAARAAVEQAKVWPNPSFSIEQGTWNPETRRAFDVTRTGSTELQLQQLIVLAGKRQKQVRLATIEREMAEHTFGDLLRALRHELRSDFYSLYYLQRAVAFDDRMIASLRPTIAAAERMAANRSILLSELVRLRSMLLAAESERVAHVNQIAELQGSLRVLLRDDAMSRRSYAPVLDERELDEVRVDTVAVERAVALALEQRPDVRTAAATVKHGEVNLSLQRALRTPDVTIGASYQRAGAYIPDYIGVGVSVDLPLFDRNRGNIKMAERTLEADQRRASAARQRAEQEVITAWQKALEADRVWRATDRRLADEYEQLEAGMLANYQRRNIDIIQFADFFESYRASMQQLITLASDRADALEGLNHAIGTTVVNP